MLELCGGRREGEGRHGYSNVSFSQFVTDVLDKNRSHFVNSVLCRHIYMFGVIELAFRRCRAVWSPSALMYN